MKRRSVLAIPDLKAGEIAEILEIAAGQKAAPGGAHRGAWADKAAVLLFQKPSLRTRVSFERAVARLGGAGIYLSPQEVGLGEREPAKDVARVLSRYGDAIVCRTFEQKLLDELAAHASVPVINALSDWEHPCQALADLLTIREHGGAQGRTLAWVGDGNNVARSLAVAAAGEGMHLRLATPADYALDDASVAEAERRASASGGSVSVFTEADEAVRDADVVYTDVWTSMGQEAEAAKRLEDFAGFQVTVELLDRAAAGAVLMHDLPAHRGEEVTDEAFEDPRSIVFDQAENRLHAQQALLWWLVQ